MPVLHPNLTSHYFIFLSLFLCRASIVQKRIIYFQDEGSLTKRMCEKGRLKLNNLSDLFFLPSPWDSIPTDFSYLFPFFILNFDAAAFLSGVSGCAWHWMPHWATNQTYHLHFPHAPLFPSRQLHTFSNYPSLVRWAPLSCPPYNNEQSLHAYLTIVSLALFFTFPSSLLISVQSPCMEMLQTGRCLTAVPVEQQNTESPSMGTGQRRFMRKIILVSTIS